MPSSEPVIRLENVTQRFRVIHERPDTVRELFSKLFRNRSSYHDFEAVKNVSFDIPHGQAVGIIGRNGSGKSTLLKIIAGVYRPSKGTVTVNGTLAPLIELGAGFHHELTGRENILLNGLLWGYPNPALWDASRPTSTLADAVDSSTLPSSSIPPECICVWPLPWPSKSIRRSWSSTKFWPSETWASS